MQVLKGIYFLETNSSMLSDMEGCFTINDAFVYRGGCGVIREAVRTLSTMTDVEFIVVSDRLIDGNCEEALRQLEAFPAQKIVATSSKDEIFKSKLSKKAKLLPYPYSYDELDALLKKICGSTVYEEGELEEIANSDVAKSVDNPFAATLDEEENTVKTPSKPARDSFQDRLKNVQLSRTAEREGRLFPQKTVAVYNQKGGVGKSTVAKELAIALACMSIQNGEETYRPKVCLCDLDLDSSDMVSLLGLAGEPNIKNWADDITKAMSKGKGRTEAVRFAEWDIKQNYLQKHESGLYVLAAPERKNESVQVNRHIVSTVLENLKLCDFDVILIDTGANIFDYTITALLAADTILAVSTCDVVSAKRIDGVLEDILQDIEGFDIRSMKLVINKHDTAFNITPEEIAGVLKLPLIGVIPDCRDITNVNNGGNSVFFGNGKNSDRQKAFAAAVRNIARQILALDQSGAVRAVGEERPTQSKKGGLFSLFGRK